MGSGSEWREERKREERREGVGEGKLEIKGERGKNGRG